MKFLITDQTNEKELARIAELLVQDSSSERLPYFRALYQLQHVRREKREQFWALHQRALLKRDADKLCSQQIKQEE